MYFNESQKLLKSYRKAFYPIFFILNQIESEKVILELLVSQKLLAKFVGSNKNFDSGNFCDNNSQKF